MADSDSKPIDQFSDSRRFWVRVKSDASGHWLWVGGTRSNGYGTFAVRRAEGRWTQTTAHRFAYQDQIGEVPAGFEVDHLCRVRNCVRPDHLEAVTVQVNRQRRDAEIDFTVALDAKPLPVIPPKPVQPPKPRPPRGPRPTPTKRGPLLFCPNGHEIAVVGRVVNGWRKDGTRLYTCSACREIQSAAKRKGNYASTRTHCPKGHPYSGNNLRQSTKFSNGRPYNARNCRTCERERNRKAWEAIKKQRVDLFA